MAPLSAGTSLLTAAGGIGISLVVGAATGWWLRARAVAQAIGVAAPPGATPDAAPAEAAQPVGEPLRDLLAAATEHADELISIVTVDGKVLHANRAFCLSLGYELGTVRLMRAAQLLAEQSRASLAEIEGVVRSEGGWRGTLVRLRQDGSTFLTSCSVLALRNDQGAVSHFVAIERDVTHETQLREQLIHSERLAAVGQLVSGVAHELNNPLQSIIGFTELLLEAERRKEPRADLDHVRTEAHRAAKIVRNLLAFVRRSATERAQASLNDLLQATVALRKYEFSISGITLDEQYAADLPPVLVNREEIQQVLLNLVLNAEQAMKPTGRPGHLVIRSHATARGVCVDIEDNGPGVAPMVARRIFEPFYSTKGVGEGTGLGLSIALGIAEAHGGTLELAGPRESGACFRLTLPPATGVAEATQPAVAAPPTWTAIPGRRALVADDEPPLRKLLHRLLTRRGFAVDLADDGLQAASMIEVNRYDLILCDVQMPRMTGMQLYESLRRRQPHLVSAFAFISGDILNEPLRVFVESAQIPLLSKPFGAKSLDLVLDEVLLHRMKSLDVPTPLEARA